MSERAGDAIPAELEIALAANAEAAQRYAALAPSHRREYAAWVDDAKQEETRRRRAARAVEMIVEGSDPP